MSGRWSIPETWEWRRAGDFAFVVGGGTPEAGDPTNFSPSVAGSIAWLTPADLAKDKSLYVTHGARNLTEKGFRNSAAKILPIGSVVFSSRAPIGYCAVTAGPLCTSQGFRSFQIRTREIIPEYLYLYLLSAKDYAESLASGSTFKELSGSKAAELLVPIAPTVEQARITAKVNSVRARSARLRTTLGEVPALLDRLRQSILAAAFRGDLTADWRARNPDVEPADKLLEKIRAERRRRWEAAELAKLTAKGKPPIDDKWKDRYYEGEIGTPALQPALPRGWAWASLDQLRAYETVVVYGIILPGDHVPGGVPYVRPVDIQPDGTVNIADLGRTTEAIAESHSRASLAAGDVILSIVGTIGKVMIVPPELSGGNITQSSARIRTGPWLSPEILRFMLMCPCLIAQYDKFRFGNAVQRLNVEHVRNLMIPLPPPEEQRVILQRLERLLGNGLAAAYSQLKEQLAHLDKAVLAKAFRGELVPQDPNDEPASVLLERLRAETAAAPAKPGRRARAATSEAAPAAPAPASTPHAGPAPGPVPVAARRAAPPEPTPAPARPTAPATALPRAQPLLPGIPAGDFLEHPADRQAEQVHALLLGEGPLEREDAVRRAADLLRDAGLASFQRLRKDGTLATCIDAAIAVGLRLGSFDRPAPGIVRALASTPDAVPPALWRRALLAALAEPETDADAAVRDAAAWSQAQFGLEFQRLRTGGRIDTALRAVLAEMLASREIVSDRHGILSPGPRRG